jgi:hypothetical protein
MIHYLGVETDDVTEITSTLWINLICLSKESVLDVNLPPLYIGRQERKRTYFFWLNI